MPAGLRANTVVSARAGSGLPGADKSCLRANTWCRHGRGLTYRSGADKPRHTFVQVQREVRCALNLASLLSRLVEGDEEAFTVAMEDEAKILVNAPFGETLIRSIGWIYKVCGKSASAAGGGRGWAR